MLELMKADTSVDIGALHNRDSNWLHPVMNLRFLISSVRNHSQRVMVEDLWFRRISPIFLPETCVPTLCLVLHP
jgi:hypothetical protein